MFLLHMTGHAMTEKTCYYNYSSRPITLTVKILHLPNCIHYLGFTAPYLIKGVVINYIDVGIIVGGIKILFFR